MISVIIPNYNHAKFLAKRLNSVLVQTYRDIEIIILDDCSTDNSREIIESYVSKDSRISFIPNKQNTGSPFIQWNRGVNLAKGEYIWIAESDDAADPQLLTRLASALESNPSVSLAYCQSAKIDEHDNITGSWKSWTDDLDKNQFEKDFIMQGAQYVDRFLVHRNTIPNASGVLFRKDVYLKVGGTDESIRNCSDWLTWLKMVLDYDVAFVADELNFFRYHSSSVIAKAHKAVSTTQYNEQFDYTMRCAFKRFISERRLHIPSAIIKNNDHYIYHDVGNEGLFNIRNGNFIKGIRQLIKASYKPAFTLNYVKRMLFTKTIAG